VVRGATQAELFEYVGTHYSPKNMLVTVAGRVEHDRVVAKAERWFGDMRNPKPVVESRIPQVHNRFVYRHRPTEQVYVCLGGEGLPLGHEGKYKLQILDNVLGGGMSSRLFQEVREKRGLVYSIGSYLYGYNEGGVFGIYAIAGPQAMREVIPIVRDICADVRENGITEREYERSREFLKGVFAIGLESSNARMTRLMRSELTHGRFVSPEEVVARIDAVTIEDVNEYARRYLDLDRYCVAALGPFRGKGRNLLSSIGQGPWLEDVGPYDKQPRSRAGRQGSEAASAAGDLAAGEVA
jgi:predicted Zn-dependent peptidase